MRLLLPVHIYLPEHRAGVEMYTAQLAREMSRDAQVAVVTTNKTISRPMGHLRQVEQDGIRVYEVNNHLGHERYEETWEQPLLDQAFSRVLDDWRPDVVHFQHTMYWSLGAARIVAGRGLPCLLTLHDFWLSCSRFGQLIDWRGELCTGAEQERCAACMSRTGWGQSAAARRWIDRAIRLRNWTGIPLDGPLRAARGLVASRPAQADDRVEARPTDPWRELFRRRRDAYLALADSVDLFVTPSASLRQHMIDWGLPEEKVRHLPQGLDHAPFRAVGRQPAPGTLRLAFVGTIAPHKGVRELIQAVSRLPPERVELVVHGPEQRHREYAGECRTLADRTSHIRFGGALDRSQLAGLYRNVDVLCVPSLWNECCPLTMQEGFIAGIPCVASDLGGMRELIENEQGGLLARPGDVENWRGVLGRLLDDPELLPRLRAGIPRVPTIEEHADAIRAIHAGLSRGRPDPDRIVEPSS